MARPVPSQGVPFRLAQLAYARPNVPNTAQRVNLASGVRDVRIGDSGAALPAMALGRAGQQFGQTIERVADKRANAPFRLAQLESVELDNKIRRAELSQLERQTPEGMGVAMERLGEEVSALSDLDPSVPTLNDLNDLNIPDVDGMDELSGMMMMDGVPEVSDGIDLTTPEGVDNVLNGISSYEGIIRKQYGETSQEADHIAIMKQGIVPQLQQKKAGLTERQRRKRAIEQAEVSRMDRIRTGITPRKVWDIYAASTDTPTAEGYVEFQSLAKSQYPNAFGPSYDEDFALQATRSSGAFIPDDNAWPQTEEAYKEALKNDYNRMGELRESNASANKIQAGLSEVEGLLRSGEFDTGGLLPVAQAKLVKWLGIEGEFTRNAQLFDAIINRLTPVMRQGMPGAASDRDVAMFRASLPSMWNSVDGNLEILKNLNKAFSRIDETLGFYESAAGKIPLYQAERLAKEYSELYPMFDRQKGGSLAPTNNGRYVPGLEGELQLVPSLMEYYQLKNAPVLSTRAEEREYLQIAPSGSTYIDAAGHWNTVQ